ncbi:MAG TPA: ATP-binding protein [Vicinamibacterales bacterium]|nr:ATP-binding protein [Vicinamibacterales bacterium]
MVATRDTGYRSLAAAVAELVDNSIQANARHVDILLKEVDSEGSHTTILGVIDDGDGMSPTAIGRALQFGGTNRFGDRSGLGRFGMGLPNSSVSYSRRLEVYSWQRPNDVYHSYLDVDEVATGRLRCIPTPRRARLPNWVAPRGWRSGTLILWTRCDRLGRLRSETLSRRLHVTLGRVYRHTIWSGARISINGVAVHALDPLFIDARSAVRGATSYGSPMRYEVVGFDGRPSVIEVQFSELPVDKWHRWSVEDKRQKGIVGGAGVSIVRAGREIDYGWYLFGGKRRENYDDWWRCELRFSPSLDELFGVTHSKQGVNPRTELKLMLSPDMEAIARTLNRRVREAFDRVKRLDTPPHLVTMTRQDALLAPPASLASRRIASNGLRYRLEYKALPEPDFYTVRVERNSIVVCLNTNHAFFSEIYQRASETGGCGPERIERLILAAARADLEARGDKERSHAARLRRAWSDALTAFLRPR